MSNGPGKVRALSIESRSSGTWLVTCLAITVFEILSEAHLFGLLCISKFNYTSVTISNNMFTPLSRFRVLKPRYLEYDFVIDLDVQICMITGGKQEPLLFGIGRLIAFAVICKIP